MLLRVSVERNVSGKLRPAFIKNGTEQSERLRPPASPAAVEQSSRTPLEILT